MNSEYFRKNEQTDYELFVELMADIAPNVKVGETPQYFYCDATATTISDIVVEHELKRRYYQFNDEKMVMVNNGKEYDEIIIEAHKLCELLLSMHITNNVHQAKYANFIINEDGTKYAICFDIHGLNRMLKKKKFSNIYSKGYEQQEDGWRFLLPIKDAIIFRKNNGGRYTKIQ